MRAGGLSETKYFFPVVFVFYSVIAVAFHGLGIDIFNTMLANSAGDAFTLTYPTKIFSASFSLWNPYIQCGTYVFKDISFQSAYPPNLLIIKLFPNIFGYNIIFILHYACAGFFAFIFFRKLNLNITASFLGGMSFMFCGFLAAHKDHSAMINAAVWLPLVLYFVERFFLRRKYSELLFAAIAFSMSILADYIAVPMYIGMMVFPYIVLKVFTEERTGYSLKGKLIDSVKYSLIIFGIGLLLSSITVIPILESLPEVTRQSIDYKFFSWYSFKLKMFPMILFPFFYGTESPGFYPIEYFGNKNLLELTGYMGVLPLISSFLSFSIYRKKDVRIYFWSIVAILGFILALGNSTVFYRIMYHVPIYNMFRVPARNWFEVNFAVSVLFAFLIHFLITEELISEAIRKKIKRSISLLFIFTAIIILIVICIHIIWIQIEGHGVSSGFFNNISELERQFPQIGLLANNTQLYPPSPVIYVPLIMISISAIIMLLLPRFYKIKKYWIAFGFILIIDLFSFGHFHLSNYNDQELLSDTSSSKLYGFFTESGCDTKTFRIYYPEKNIRLLWPNINMLYGLSAIQGYNTIWLTDYASLTGFKTSGISENYDRLLENGKILSMLSVKYILVSDPSIQKALSPVGLNDGNQKNISRRYVKRFEDNDGNVIYENLGFLPRSRFVRALRNVNGINEVIDIIYNDRYFNPEDVAMVEASDLSEISGKGEVLSADYHLSDRITLKVKTEDRSFLVLSDTYYPGWKAYIGNSEIKIYKVNGVSRGIYFDKGGVHTIKFVFKPFSFYLGLTLSLISFFVVICYCVYDLRQESEEERLSYRE